MTSETVPSPAERYAAAKARNRTPVLQAFAAGLAHPLDAFQREACESLETGRSVLVAAPTGAGKTIVAEFAIYQAMQGTRDKVFYTTPMKALSNQKFNDLVETYGPDDVGLLTGDVNINADARIVVMTTEVLRNMLYADSPLLNDLACVVLDEVHYLADRFRGAVWEEVIIHLPRRVRMVSLSATVSNVEEFGDWLQTVRGETDVIVSEERPVPLDQHVLVRRQLVDLFQDPLAVQQGRAATVNRELVELTRRAGARAAAGYRDRDGRVRGHGRTTGARGPRGFGRDSDRVPRPEVVRLLSEQNLLPAIFFVFSRAGCDQAVQQLVRAGIRLTTGEEREEIRDLVEDRARQLPDEDLGVLGYWDWLSALERGVAAHHAGLLPTFKEIVEELFRRKLVKAVFATETLALGINMPARTVVLESLEKFNGEARVPITPGEYTQLTGRAGRRGIDVEGHSVVQWQPGMDPAAIASLASRRTYPLNSSFRPTYNMAANLIDQFGRSRTREILESSFAQFQADRSVVGLAREVKEGERSLAGYAEAMTCDLGDFAGYSGIRRELSDLEKLNRRDVTASRATRDARQRQIQALRTRMQRHPCHRCPDREQHARWAERYWKLKRQIDKQRRQIETRTGTVARVFDRVVDVLATLEYVEDTGDGVALTAAGRTMRRIYGERDLLVAESLRRGIWSRLDAPSLAALVCALVYEPRRDEAGDDRSLPRGVFRVAMSETSDLWQQLDDLEREHHLPGSQAPATGLSGAMYQWARGAVLDRVLIEADMAAGDFVRWAKQTIDLLDQLSLVADDPVGSTARVALDAVRRGIVAYSSV